VTDQDVWSVGYKVVPAGDSPSIVQPLATMWNGTKSVVVKTPLINSQHAEFNSVSMTAANDGWAVGFAKTPGTNTQTYSTLAEHWNGTTWSTVPTPDPTPNGIDLLVGVKALTATEAVAVGRSSPVSETPYSPVAEFWNGTSWTDQPAISVGTLGTALLGVDGTGPDDIWAVGYDWTPSYQDQPVVEHWDGTGWTVMENDPGGTDAVLTSVSDEGPDDVWAVGYTDGFQPFAEHWDGSAWSVSSVPSSNAVELLRGVVDLSPDDAWAVGSSYVAGTTDAYEGVYAHWDGSQWTSGSLPTPPGGSNRIGKGLQIRGLSVAPGSSQLWTAGGIPGQVLENLCDPSGLALAPGGPVAVPSAAPVAGTSSASPKPVPPAPAEDLGRGLLSADSVGVARKGTGPEPVYAVDDAAAAGIAQNTTGWTATVNDFNGDGLPDIFLMRGAKMASLYLNNGKGGFTEIDNSTFIPADRWDCVSAPIAVGQHPAIYCAIGADHGNGLKASELYVQGADTTYTDQASSYGLLDPTGRGRIATFIHVGKGSLPDLFVGQDPFRSDGLPHTNHLYTNTGSGFVDIPQAGLDQPYGSNCAVPGDYLNTGYEDLLLCTPSGNEHLYQDNDGSFTDVTAASGLPAVPAVDAAFADLNGDGLLDLVLVTPTELLVFLQKPDHTFQQSYSLPLQNGAGVATGDVDRGGVPDIYVVQGGNGTSNAPDIMLLNNGSGTDFTQLAVPETTVGTGDNAYPIDFEKNGLTDFLVLNGNGEHVPGPLQFITFLPVKPPSSPVVTSATAGDAQATVVFSPPTSDHGSAVTGYTVTADDSTTPANGGQTATGAASPLTVTGLTNGDSYTFTVTASNTAGTSSPSAPSVPIVPAA
jgi:hypothetical protein